MGYSPTHWQLGRTCVLYVTVLWLSAADRARWQALWRERLFTSLPQQPQPGRCCNSVGRWKEASPQYERSCFALSRSFAAAPTMGVWCSEPPGLSLDPTGHLAVCFQGHLSVGDKTSLYPWLLSAILARPPLPSPLVSLDGLLF